MKRRARVLGVVALLAGGALGVAFAADEKKLGWADTAELSYVLSTGNARANTLGFKNVATRTWADALFTLKAGAVRAQSTDFTRFIAGSAGNYVLAETSDSKLVAEDYFLNGQYDHNISPAFYWTAGLGWERNRFAGYDSRIIANAGVGNVWISSDDTKWKTSYALTYTRQKDESGDTNNFAGARGTSDFSTKVSATTTFQNLTILDLNFKTGSAWRVDMTNSIAVAINKRLALKSSLQFLYANRPPLLEVTGPAPDNPGLVVTVTDDRKKLDTLFTTSLVINF